MSSHPYDYDLFVIGAGSGGVRAARMAANMGVRTAVAEDGRLGGTCVNIGCVPKKLFVYASHFSDNFADAPGFGWSVGETSFDWPTLIANKDREIDRLNAVYGNLLDQSGVTLLPARASFVDAHTLRVGDTTVTADKILIATGGRPVVPELPGREHAIVSDHAFYLDELPDRIVINGGGYIAVEFAGIFHGLGVEVTQLYRGPMFLRGFDDDLRHHLADAMRNRGIDLRFDTNIERIEKGGDRFTASLTDGSTIDAGQIMYATGRAPNTVGLGLDDIGIELSKNGAVVVDQYSKTNIDHIYAVGDVTDRVALTPVAIHEAAALVRTVFADEPTPVDHHLIPTAVFSQPPMATVGCTEAHAREEHGEVDVYRSTFTPMHNTLSGRAEKMLMKMIVDRASQRVLGIHVLGPDAAEIVQGFAVAVKMGATKAQLDATIGIHPSAAEELVTMRDPVV